MLLGCDSQLLGLLALRELGQAAFVIVTTIVTALFVDGDKPVEENDLTGGPQDHLLVVAGDIDRRPLKPRGGHLARDGAFIDQIVELALVGIGRPQLFRRQAHICGPDTLVGFLRVLGLVLVHPRACGQVITAEPILDRIPRGHDRLGGHVDPVGAHIGDVARLIEALGGRHGLARAHAEFAAGFLLERRGHEGRRGVARGGLGLDRFHRQSAALHGADGHLGPHRIRQIEFLELLARKADKAGVKLLPARILQPRRDRPVFLCPERLDLHLALDDEPQADRLHAPRRFRPRQFAPENRREVEPHEIIERAAGQIGLDQGGVDLARVSHRLCDGRLGDGVESDAADGGILLDRFAGGQRLSQVPADRLALAIGVGGEDKGGIVFQRIGNGFDVLFAVRRDLPFHRESLLGIDRTILGGQVANVAVGGKDGIFRPEVFVDCLGLSRGFNNNYGHL